MNLFDQIVLLATGLVAIYLIWRETCGGGRVTSMKTSITVICGVAARKTTSIIYESGLVTAPDRPISAQAWVFAVRGMGSQAIRE